MSLVYFFYYLIHCVYNYQGVQIWFSSTYEKCLIIIFYLLR